MTTAARAQAPPPERRPSRRSSSSAAMAPTTTTRCRWCSRAARASGCGTPTGRRYLDMLSAYSAVNQGHCHPRSSRALIEQAQRARGHLPRLPQRPARPLPRELCRDHRHGPRPADEHRRRGGRDGDQGGAQVGLQGQGRARRARPRSSSAPATSTAARRPSSASRPSRSTATASAPSRPASHACRSATPPRSRRRSRPNTAAFLVEPIQGEAGIIVPPDGLSRARCARSARAHNVLLIVDEIQTGLGRTGKLFACEHEGIAPDVLIARQGARRRPAPGVAPSSRREDVMASSSPATTAAPSAATRSPRRSALAALDVLEDEELAERARELGRVPARRGCARSRATGDRRRARQGPAGRRRDRPGARRRAQRLRRRCSTRGVLARRRTTTSSASRRRSSSRASRSIRPSPRWADALERIAAAERSRPEGTAAGPAAPAKASARRRRRRPRSPASGCGGTPRSSRRACGRGSA